jgi:hypothetical protein
MNNQVLVSESKCEKKLNTISLTNYGAAARFYIFGVIKI